MPIRLVSLRIAAASLFVASVFFPGPVGDGVQADESRAKGPLPQVPVELPAAEGGVIQLPDAAGTPRATTIDPALQQHLTAYLADNHSPIAGIVVADARTGDILAMAQGRAPAAWGSARHTALHTGFPAASLFKTVVTTAAFELVDFDALEPVGLTGGCGQVRESGEWLKEKEPTKVDHMSLRRAFGLSCNGFYAKIAVNNLGLGVITDFARRYGWETGVPTDFALDRSPFYPPSPQNSSTSTVGRFAAGFGYVGISAVHAAWMMMTVANDGLVVPMRLFKDTVHPPANTASRIFSAKTAKDLRTILDSSTHGGTATHAFRRGKYRKLQHLVGGKTGTLTGAAPRGLTTWFAGVAPLDNPEIVVAAVVVLDERWHIKAPNLAAEGVWAYYERRTQKETSLPMSLLPMAEAPALR